jgi:YVTN family beta-propeller protein
MSWQLLDDNPASVSIVVELVDFILPGGGALYQLHNDGRIFQYTGPPLTGWQELDDNPATTQIVAAADLLYQLHSDGSIYQYTGTPVTGWEQLDNNPATTQIAASGNIVYQRHNNGLIWGAGLLPLSITPVTVGNYPVGVAVTPDGQHAYVTNRTAPGTVSVIDTTTNAVLTTVGVGSGPVGVAVAPGGGPVYVANNNSTTVSVVDV